MNFVIKKVACLFLIAYCSLTPKVESWNEPCKITISNGFSSYYKANPSDYFSLDEMKDYWAIPESGEAGILSTSDIEILNKLLDLFHPDYYHQDIYKHMVKWDASPRDSLIGGRFQINKYRFIIKQLPSSYIKLFIIGESFNCKKEVSERINEVLILRDIDKDKFAEPQLDFFVYKNPYMRIKIRAYNTTLIFSNPESSNEDGENIEKNISVIELESMIYRLPSHKKI
ncbi:MAG: hypothetical protein GY855_03415 [candidate division Zixibacteria bacterium]|nr:hypothetical protein [candidate division Zixibacteria bacterium]